MKTVSYQFKNLILVLVVLALGIPGWAQQTRDQHPNASGLSATAQSIPGMSQAQREGLKNPEQGTLVYQTDNAAGYYMNEGTPEQPRWTPVTFGGQMPAPEAVDNGSRAPLSGERGFLPPRLTDAQMNAIAGPAEGLLIYNYTQKKLCVYSNSAWDCTVFCKAPATPGAITGNPPYCNYSNEIFSIAAVSGATSYTWSYSGNGTLTPSGTSCTLYATSAGTLSVRANNVCGSSGYTNLAITFPALLTPGAITGNSPYCANQTEYFTISPVAGATSYIWGTNVSGGTISGTGTTGTFTGTSIGSTGNVFVSALNACGYSGDESTLEITISGPPDSPGPITGTPPYCNYTNEVFSIAPVSGATSYTWSYSGAGTLTPSGTSCTLNATSAGTLSVRANGVCGSSGYTNLAITFPALLTPGAITGNSPYCANQTEDFTIAAVTGATSYLWETFVPGGTITGTGTTGSFTGTTIGASGIVRVAALNACGYSGDESTVTITVGGPPAAPASISGSQIQCKGKTYTYTCAASSGATSYTWSYSGSGTPSGTGTSATLAATGSGSLSVCASDVCGCSSTTQIGITAEGVYNSTTKRCWEDRNMGATQVATSSTDALAYGYLYQWGRGNDGHQLRSSGSTTTLSSTDSPGHNKFIVTSADPWDWRSPSNSNLWQGLSGINNPCPTGYRLPTQLEWMYEYENWSSANAAGAFASPLKLTMGGRRNINNILEDVGTYGNYWGSTAVTGSFSHEVVFLSNYVGNQGTPRSYGHSVRCIRDVTP